MKMNILHVIPYFVPAWDYGGPVPVCYELSKRLVERGHNVTIYTTDVLDAGNRIREKEETIDGIIVRRFKNASNTIAYQHHIFVSPGMLFERNRELNDFDIIHMHEYRTIQNVIVHHYAKRFGIPYVVQGHGALRRIITKQNLKKLYDNLWGYKLLRDASRVIALNETEAAQYKSMGVIQDRITIVPNGIDPSEFNNLPERGKFREKYGLNDKQQIILYLGRIHQAKGLDLLAEAFAKLSKSLNNIKLVIVGPDDGYLPSVKKLIANLEMGDKVLFIGPLYGEEKLQAYVSADVFVTPSFYGFPVTFMEACACGVPIVTTTRWDRLDWMHGQVGLVVPYDKNQLQDAIANLLSDEGLRIRFGENGKMLVRERFNWTKIVEQVEDIYSTITRSS